MRDTRTICRMPGCRSARDVVYLRADQRLEPLTARVGGEVLQAECACVPAAIGGRTPEVWQERHIGQVPQSGFGRKRLGRVDIQPDLDTPLSGHAKEGRL